MYLYQKTILVPPLMKLNQSKIPGRLNCRSLSEAHKHVVINELVHGWSKQWLCHTKGQCWFEQIAGENEYKYKSFHENIIYI